MMMCSMSYGRRLRRKTGKGAVSALLLLLSSVLACGAATYVWDDTPDADNVSIYKEANWLLVPGGTSIPVINANTPVNHDLVVDEVTSGNPGGGSGGSGTLDLGSGSLTINAGVFRMNTGSSSGVHNGPISMSGTGTTLIAYDIDNCSLLSCSAGTVVVVSDGIGDSLISNTGADVTATFLLNTPATLGAGTLTLSGGGNPLNGSTVNFVGTPGGTLHFLDETPADVVSEHLAYLMVDGAAAVVDTNITILSDGNAGTIVSRLLDFEDTDHDSMDDHWERTHFLDLSRDGTGDKDNDGLNDLGEYTEDTDPNEPDSDGDALTDGDEVATHASDPLDVDSDDDGTPDGMEVARGLSPTDPAEHLDRPNIVFILCDDLGYGDLGVLWQNGRGDARKLATPNLDQMAAEGTIMRQHYTGAPVCAPARSSLLTGVHQGHATVRNTDFDNALEHNHTVGSTLQSAGYATAAIGKYGLQGSGSSPASWSAYPTKRGFDFFHGYVRHTDGHQHYPGNSWPIGNSSSHRSPKELYENYTEISGDLDKCFTPDLFTARAKKWMVDQQAAHPNQPFFLYLAFDTPHAALQIPTQAYPAGSGVTGGVQWLGTSGNMINTASGTIDSWRHPDFTGKGWSDEEERFATLVRRMDSNVGDLLQTLNDLNIATNTLVVFTADNGPHTEHYIAGGSYNASAFDSFGPFEGIKRDCLEGGVRQPTLVWWPGTVAPNQVRSTPSQFQDWMASFADLAGWPTPARSDGVSLVPTLTGDGTQREGIVYVEFNQGGSAPAYPEFVNHAGDPRGNQQVIFLDGYKGLRNGIGSHADDFQVYDVSVDLAEATNLYTSPPSGQAAYFADLQQRMKDRVLRVRMIEKDDPFDPGNDKTETRPYDGERVPPVTVAVTSGIQVATFEGIWPWLPEFDELTPVTVGVVADFNVAAHLSRPHDAGLLYQGCLDVPAAGTWTFYATSDAGTHLRIHEAQVVDDDFNHDGSTAGGTILLEAGMHPFSLYYRTASAAPALSMEWSGPGTARQAIPVSVLHRALPPPPEPVAVDDEAVTTRDTPVVIDALFNDTDDGAPQPLSVQSVGPASGGSHAVESGGIRYTPHPYFLGEDRFPYTITDGQYTDTATITVSVVHRGAAIWLPLNACSGGTEVYEAGGALAGNMTGFADPDAARIPGRHGLAIAFDGADDEVPVSSVLQFPVGDAPRTAMAWVRVQPGGASGNQGIFGYGANSSGRRFTFRLDDSAGQRVRLEVQSGSIVGNATVDDGQWHHVAVVCNDFTGDGALDVRETKVYVDGVLDANPFDAADPIITPRSSDSQAMDTTSNNPVLGGASHSGGFSFDGDIDEFRLFPYAMTSADIAQYAAASNQVAAAWHQRYFGDDAVDWSAHDDTDAANRLLEYGMGGQPHADDGDRFLLRPAMVGDHLRVTYPRRLPNCHDLDYIFQLTDDLVDWDRLTATEVGVSPNPDQLGMENVTVEADATGTSAPFQASRVRIEL